MRVVIGVGNPDRGDDGVGRLVAQQLRDCSGAELRILEHNGEVTALLEWLERAEAAYLIDAAASGAAPGTIHRFDACDGPLPQGVFALSTHGFGPAEAIELARAMGCLPSKCVIFAIEGKDFESGQSLSEPVRTAAHEVAQRLRDELAG